MTRAIRNGYVCCQFIALHTHAHAHAHRVKKNYVRRLSSDDEMVIMVFFRGDGEGYFSFYSYFTILLAFLPIFSRYVRSTGKKGIAIPCTALGFGFDSHQQIMELYGIFNHWASGFFFVSHSERDCV